MKTIAALIPIKVQGKAKTRLSGVIEPELRAALAEAMALDLLHALRQVRALGAVYVVSKCEEVAKIVRPLGIKFLLEPENVEGLNGAVDWAAGHLAAEGWKNLMVIHGDLPLAQAQDIADCIAAHGSSGDEDAAVTLVPATSDAGTNAIVCSPPDIMAFQFGKDSFAAHKAAARGCGIEPRIFQNDHLGFDVDTPDDLNQLMDAVERGDAGPNTRQLLSDHNSAPFEQIDRILETPLGQLMAQAARIRDQEYGNTVTYSRKVFIPVTQLCRDVCHYCTYAKTPRLLDEPYLTIDEMVEIARKGAASGCKEALFTLGEKPELRYRAAAAALREMGFATTLEYVVAAAKAVFEATGLLPHLNPGIMTADELDLIRPVCASAGLMLEGTAPSLTQKGGAHYGSPDKDPVVRLDAIAAAGKAKIPFTTGILIGIGESRRERLEALQSIGDLHNEHGHIQEVIIQNFCAKPGTIMANAKEPGLEEVLWTLAAARVLLPAEISLQAPPNLNEGVLPQLIAAGLNDWGGVSPVTPDHVNPEAPWPHLDKLARETASAGKILAERLAVHPRYIAEASEWLAKDMAREVLRKANGMGLAREGNWVCGGAMSPPEMLAFAAKPKISRQINETLTAIADGVVPDKQAIAQLFEATGDDATFIAQAANQLRDEVIGGDITYVINRNINYTNICNYSCAFCAFAKGAKNRNLRGPAYNMDLDTIVTQAFEAWEDGATEVCLQGGIHPKYTGQTYLDICAAVKRACPDMHIHGFSPLEVSQGAETLGLTVADFLAQLKQAGLGSLPGTAAEILDDDVRDILCPDKLDSDEWVEVVETAHAAGLDTTSTIMFGHVDSYANWATHLLKLRALQVRSLARGKGKITEFVPLPFVAMEAPIFLRGQARMGPTFREVLLMHAVARLVLHPVIANIQTSWVKLGDKGAAACLAAGANDLGGTLMNERISSAAGSTHGSERTQGNLKALVRRMGRTPRRRETTYGPASEDADVISIENTTTVALEERRG